MNKTPFRKTVCLLLSVALLVSSMPAFADPNENKSMDQRSAYAGASLSLAQFFNRNEDAAQSIADALAPIIDINGADPSESGNQEGTTDELLYRSSRIGVVCTEGNLNIREAPTTLADVVAKAYSQSEIWVVGERVVNGNLWYKVKTNGVSGYAFAKYILFDEDAVDFFNALYESYKISAKLPDTFDITEDTSKLDASTLENLKSNASNIRYCLTYAFPNAEEEESYLNMYSVLSYMLELYQSIMDVAAEFEMGETYRQCEKDMQNVRLTRERLVDVSETSDEEFQRQIAEAVEKRIKEQQAQQKVLTLGEQIANFATTFIGWLPYVWGGASLQYGADCSGFCQQIYAAFGLLDQHTADLHGYDSSSLRRVGYEVPLSAIQPGDMVYYNGHVGIYYGNGIMVHEPSRNKTAEFRSIYELPIICVRRLY